MREQEREQERGERFSVEGEIGRRAGCHHVVAPGSKANTGQSCIVLVNKTKKKEEKDKSAEDRGHWPHHTSHTITSSGEWCVRAWCPLYRQNGKYYRGPDGWNQPDRGGGKPHLLVPQRRVKTNTKNYLRGHIWIDWASQEDDAVVE